jgi:co-chaperonin GroES (HSP10)
MADFKRSDIDRLDERLIIPHGDRYLVEKLTIDNTYVVELADGSTKLIPIEGTQNKEERDGYYIAEVVAKGNGHRLETNTVVPMPFDRGDVVMVEKFSGRELQIAGSIYTIVNQVDCLAVLPELTKLLHPEEFAAGA